MVDFMLATSSILTTLLLLAGGLGLGAIFLFELGTVFLFWFKDNYVDAKKSLPPPTHRWA